MAIYIPEKIKVGFVERDDTFDGKLSYINYINKSKKWALERSWENWRDSKFDPVFLDNTPIAGFVIHKGHNRYSDFAGKTTMIRIYHPSGFEFEITPSNLCAVLTHSNTSAGFISQECILGWEGGSVILLPTNSDIYKEAKEITDGYKEKLDGNLIIGNSYHFNGDNETKHVYLGSYNLYKKDRYANFDYNKRVKNHFFLKIYENIFEEYSEVKHGGSYTLESYKEFIEKGEMLYREVIVAPKSKVWREVQKEDETVYKQCVNDLKDFEENLNQNKVKFYEFENFKESEISHAANCFVKLKITQNFNNIEKNIGHSDEFLENVNSYKITDDELNFMKNNLLLSDNTSESKEEILIRLFTNEESHMAVYKYWGREHLKKIIGTLTYDKCLYWSDVTFFDPLETNGESIYLYNKGSLNKKDSEIDVRTRLERLKKKRKILDYFYNELVKKFANEINGRTKNLYYSHYEKSVYIYDYKLNDNEFDKKYDEAFFEILTSKGFHDVLKDELKKLTFENKTILNFYGI